MDIVNPILKKCNLLNGNKSKYCSEKAENDCDTNNNASASNEIDDSTSSDLTSDFVSEDEVIDNEVDDGNQEVKENCSVSESENVSPDESELNKQSECSESCFQDENAEENRSDSDSEYYETKDFTEEFDGIAQKSIHLNHLGEELIDSTRKDLREMISVERKFCSEQQADIEETKNEIASVKNDFSNALYCIKQIYDKIQNIDSILKETNNDVPKITSFIEKKCMETNRGLSNIEKNIGGYERLRNFFLAYSDLETMDVILSSTNQTNDYETLAKEIGFRISNIKKFMGFGFADNGITLLCPEEKSDFDSLLYICDEPIDNIVNPVVKRTKHTGFKFEENIIEKPVVEVKEKE